MEGAEPTSGFRLVTHPELLHSTLAPHCRRCMGLPPHTGHLPSFNQQQSVLQDRCYYPGFTTEQTKTELVKGPRPLPAGRWNVTQPRLQTPAGRSRHHGDRAEASACTCAQPSVCGLPLGPGAGPAGRGVAVPSGLTVPSGPKTRDAAESQQAAEGRRGRACAQGRRRRRALGAGSKSESPQTAPGGRWLNENDHRWTCFPQTN